jgi:hypothetical protein
VLISAFAVPPVVPPRFSRSGARKSGGPYLNHCKNCKKPLFQLLQYLKQRPTTRKNSHSTSDGHEFRLG